MAAACRLHHNTLQKKQPGSFLLPLLRAMILLLLPSPLNYPWPPDTVLHNWCMPSTAAAGHRRPPSLRPSTGGGQTTGSCNHQLATPPAHRPCDNLLGMLPLPLHRTAGVAQDGLAPAAACSTSCIATLPFCGRRQPAGIRCYRRSLVLLRATASATKPQLVLICLLLSLARSFLVPLW